MRDYVIDFIFVLHLSIHLQQKNLTINNVNGKFCAQFIEFFQKAFKIFVPQFNEIYGEKMK